MEDHTLSPISDEMLKGLSKQEICTLFRGEQSIRQQMQAELDSIKRRYTELEDSVLDIKGKFVRLKAKLFGPSSEKTKPATGDKTGSGKSGKKGSGKKRTDFSKKPSERYPNTPIIEKELELETTPECELCCGAMEDSGLAEVSEYLTIEPRKYTIVRQVRHKYRCRCCHGSMVTTPQLPRIKPGSAYSDEMIIDIAMSKYCDLIPVERYAAMAAREGFVGLPANSLIEATHHLADFLQPAKHRIKEEALADDVLCADETPHKMLEGDKKTKNWFLWGFSTLNAAFFECHNTRSGDVASELLKKSKAEVLVSDVYSGYSKAIRVVNKFRQGSSELKAAYCNAHARRKFKEAEDNFAEQVSVYLRCYRIIAKLEDWGKRSGKLERNRKRMVGIFEKMRRQGQSDLQSVSQKSELARAINYFEKNYDGLTLCLQDIRIPLDNNRQEGLLRNPVVGRKTWYGTHSKKGARTAATLFTITESCKLNKVNPRSYVQAAVAAIHAGEPPPTPYEYKQQKE